MVTYSKSGRPRLGHGGKPDIPLPFMLVFCGYTFILVVDKVMFDSHAFLVDTTMDTVMTTEKKKAR